MGAWKAVNTTTTTQPVAVSLQGVAGRRLTLIVSNPGDAAVPMPAITLPRNVQAQALQASAGEMPEAGQIPARIRDFVPPAFDARTLTPARRSAINAAVLNTRNWKIVNASDQLETRSATLRSTLTAGDGRAINFWVEDSEYGSGKITDSIIQSLAASFASGANSVYSVVTGVAGQPWGAHRFSNLIPASQPLDIVLVNFDRNDKAYGMLGYFWSLNNFVRGSGELADSNESLSFYLDTETLYKAGAAGQQIQVSTLAHEFTHMINFYQRAVSLGNPFATPWEEMSAIMMEDLVSERIHPGLNTIANNRFADWLNSADFNCDLLSWNSDPYASCFGYAHNGSFGAYLLRQYGLGFYKDFLRAADVPATTQPGALLDGAIRRAGGTGFAEAQRRWVTNLALLPAAASPAGFGYPQRDESGFRLVPINGPDYASVRRMPATVPAQLVARGHFPFERMPTSDAFNETIQLPAGTTLSVIVQ